MSTLLTDAEIQAFSDAIPGDTYLGQAKRMFARAIEQAVLKTALVVAEEELPRIKSLSRKGQPNEFLAGRAHQVHRIADAFRALAKGE